MIQPTASFKTNLSLLPSIENLARIDLHDAQGKVVDSIENQPGKQGSLAVYNYLAQSFDSLDAQAARHALEVFGEHTQDARNRPGAHPNIDRLLSIVEGGSALHLRCVAL